jgi:hypothetical protein
MNMALPSYLTSIHSFGNRMSTDLPPKLWVTNDDRLWRWTLRLLVRQAVERGVDLAISLSLTISLQSLNRYLGRVQTL